MAYKLVKQVKENDTLRSSFIDLAVETFDLSFEKWYQSGFWTDKYIPYAFVDEDRVIANASVNVIDTIWQATPKRYIQIGTVMTDTSYRNQGLSRRLMEEIMTDWKDECDAMYLFANDTVLDFYPKFGFQKEVEYQYTIPVIAGAGDFEKLDMESQGGRELLRRCYQRSNPFSQLPMEDNYGLLMFYCGAFMKNAVYYSKKRDAVCVATQEENTLICFDIFCDQGNAMEAILSETAGIGTQQAVLGFTPKDTRHCKCQPIDEEDNTLFVLAGKENVFAEGRVMFPSLSHA